MKIKRTRQVRLDELLRLVWDEKITGEKFYDQDGNILFIDNDGGHIEKADHTCKSDLFTITDELEVRNDTLFDELVIVLTKHFDNYNNKIVCRVVNRSISECKKAFNELHEVWTMNGNSIGQLIWKDGEMVE